MSRFILVFAFAGLACAQHGEPHKPPPAKVVEAPVEEPTPEPEAEPEPVGFECTRSAYEVIERWKGEGSSAISQADARAQAEAAACNAAGQGPGCIDQPDFMSAQTSMSSRSSFVDGKMSSSYEAVMTLASVGRSAESTQRALGSKLEACANARHAACSRLGYEGCNAPGVIVPNPKGGRGPFGLPAASEP